MSDLTLAKGTLPAAYQTMTVLDGITMDTERQEAWNRIRREFPALIGLEGDEFANHTDRPRYLAVRDWWTLVFPAIRAAWAGEGPPPRLDQLETSYRREIIASARAVVALNPDLADLADLLGPAPETTPGNA